MIAKDIQDDKNTPIYKTYACEDPQNNIQGLIILTELTQGIFITHLVANPIHLRSSINERDVGGMRGIGTYLLKIAEEVAIQRGQKMILVSPLFLTEPFYEKNGFAFCDIMCMSKKVEKTSQKAAPLFERLVA